MPPAYYLHPEFGHFCLGPAARRELRIAVASILFGMVIGAAIVTVGAGHAVELDGGSSNAHLKPLSSDTFLAGPGVPSSQFTNVEPRRWKQLALSDADGASAFAGPPEPILILFGDRRDSEGFRSMR